MTAPETPLERIEGIAFQAEYEGYRDWAQELRDCAEALRRTPTTGGEEDTARLDWLEEEHEGEPRLSKVLNLWWRLESESVRAAIDAARTTRSTGEE